MGVQKKARRWRLRFVIEDAVTEAASKFGPPVGSLVFNSDSFIVKYNVFDIKPN